MLLLRHAIAFQGKVAVTEDDTAMFRRLRCLTFPRCGLLLIAVTTVLSVCSWAWCAPAQASSQDRDEAVWRKKENDWLHCAFLFETAMAGRRTPFETYCKENSRNTNGSSAGKEYLPVRLTFTELKKLGMPVIVHLEPTENSGGFYLFLSANSYSVALFQGGAAKHILLSKDDFLTQWNGFVFLPAHPRLSSEAIAFHWGIGISVLILGSSLFYRTLISPVLARPAEEQTPNRL